MPTALRKTEKEKGIHWLKGRKCWGISTAGCGGSYVCACMCVCVCVGVFSCFMSFGWHPIWVPLKGESETRTEVHLIYLEGDPGSGSEERDGERRRARRYCSKELNMSCWGQPGLSPAGAPLKGPYRIQNFYRIFHSGGQGRLGHLSTDPCLPLAEVCSQGPYDPPTSGLCLLVPGWPSRAHGTLQQGMRVHYSCARNRWAKEMRHGAA